MSDKSINVGVHLFCAIDFLEEMAKTLLAWQQQGAVTIERIDVIRRADQEPPK